MDFLQRESSVSAKNGKAIKLFLKGEIFLSCLFLTISKLIEFHCEAELLDASEQFQSGTVNVKMKKKKKKTKKIHEQGGFSASRPLCHAQWKGRGFCPRL